MCDSTGDADSFGIDAVNWESADGGLFETENTYYRAFFTSGWTSANASETAFSTEIPVDAGSAHGAEIPFSKNVLCLTVDPDFEYAPDAASCTGIPVDTGFAYWSGVACSTELPFAHGSCHLQITDQSACNQHTDYDAVHMSWNGSISVRTSKSGSFTV